MPDIVICTPYTVSDITRCAIQLAEMLQAHSYSAYLAATSSTRARLGVPWDDRLLDFDLESSSWCPRATFIWMQPPQIDFYDVFCSYGRGHIVLYSQPGSDYQALAEAEHVVCLSERLRLELESKLSHLVAHCIPWSIGGPVMTSPAAELRRCLLPLHDNYARQIHPKYVSLAAKQSQAAGYQLQITCRPGQLAKYRKLVRRTGASAEIIEITDDLKERSAFAETDLVLWPADQDLFGRVPQLAGYSGVPVLTWECSPLSEIVQPGLNGVLVPRGDRLISTDHSRLWDEFAVLSTPGFALADIRRVCLAHLEHRYRAFQRGWLDLLEQVT